MGVYVTQKREQIKDLDSIAYPNRSYVNYDKYKYYPNEAAVTHCISLQGTRGCPYNCVYCHKIWPKSHVFRSAENILEEIKIYYDMGIKRFAFIDDIFNFNQKNSTRFFETILKKNMNIQIFFPNGTRGDILDKDYIDLMVEAGTVYIPMALESASARIQRIIKKNLDLDRLHDNMDYICKKYPNVISALFFMIGFPTETEEEAFMTLDFVKSLKWVHFPELHALTIYPGTEMEKIAIENGISKENILRGASNAFHETPTTLPFKDKTFLQRYRAIFLKEYWLNKDRIKTVLPGQLKIMTEQELTMLYNSYLHTKFKAVQDILKFLKISSNEFETLECVPEEMIQVDNMQEKMCNYFGEEKANEDAFRMLFLDVTHYFSSDYGHAFTGFAEPPLGHMYLATNLKREYKEKVVCKVSKSFIDFDSYHDLKKIIDDFQPDAIGLRCMTFYKDFFHGIVKQIRDWNIQIPIITGGPHPTTAYEEVLQDENIDLVVVGEGEATLSEIIGKMIENNKKLPSEAVLKSIAGICFRM